MRVNTTKKSTHTNQKKSDTEAIGTKHNKKKAIGNQMAAVSGILGLICGLYLWYVYKYSLFAILTLLSLIIIGGSVGIKPLFFFIANLGELILCFAWFQCDIDLYGYDFDTINQKFNNHREITDEESNNQQYHSMTDPKNNQQFKTILN